MTVALDLRPFWDLSRSDAATALVAGEETLTYSQLAHRVDAIVGRLGPTRRLVHLEAANDVSTVVGYLACLVGGHPVLVTERGSVAGRSAAAAYDPDVVLGRELEELRPGTAHDLHPELAVLLSTSGSTGSPKLVRLSRSNVATNAAAIATTLGIRAGDTAATTLPLHYCYGLSVLTSHLAAGASLLLTADSVVAPSFWDDVRRHGVTTFPGVPHTFELLDRIGFADDVDAPSLRYLTCAGGRLAPAAVRRYAALGLRRGFDLFVMYGATEATARMAVLSPDRALTHPGLLGEAVPGGSFTLRPVEGSSDVDELVYTGDNVMLGYAESPGDLNRGRDIEELRTGDLARSTPDGLEIVGRLGRRAKVFGLRVDLDRLESSLCASGVVGYAADGGDRVVIGVDRSARPLDERAVETVLAAAEAAGVPRAGCVVTELDGVPRLGSGKVDHGAVAATADAARPAPPRPPEDVRAAVVAALAPMARRHVTPADSFVSLGGDSLSYVETSLRLERALGHLPQRWHLRTVAELVVTTEARPERRAMLRDLPSRWGVRTTNARRSVSPTRAIGRAVETNVLLRAAAIVVIVGSHANLFTLLGGAHLLVGLLGFNLARFHLTDRPRAERVRGILTSVGRVAVPSVLWLAFAAATSAKYDWRNVILLNGVLGTREWSEAWHYWFIEALVWTLLGIAVLLAIPWVHRVERRWPFWFPVGLAGLGLLTRYDVVRLLDGDYLHRAHVIFWLFALGWAAAQATRTQHRLVVSGLVVVTTPGFFEGQPEREALVVAGFLLLVWVPTLRVPAVLARVAGVLASASLFIYLCHWQIYPAYEFSLPWLATGLSLAAGVAFWLTVGQVSRVIHATRGEMPEIGKDPHGFSLRRYLTRDETPIPPRGALG